MVKYSLEAAKMLAGDGIEAAVFDARFAHPVDIEAIKQLAADCGRLVTVEENAVSAGFGSAVAEALDAAGHPPVPLRRLGIPHKFIQHGGRDQLLEQIGLTPEGISTEVKAFLANKSRQYS
jgi:1-deoxy-D-xylulose-5-phosphate synthase